jgi:hypothetical protein
MTAKEALAQVYRYFKASHDWLRLVEPDKITEVSDLRAQTIAAIFRLVPAIHGKPPASSSGVLCESCFLRYAEWADNGRFDLCSSCRKMHAPPAQTPEVPS